MTTLGGVMPNAGCAGTYTWCLFHSRVLHQCSACPDGGSPSGLTVPPACVCTVQLGNGWEQAPKAASGEDGEAGLVPDVFSVPDNVCWAGSCVGRLIGPVWRAVQLGDAPVAVAQLQGPLLGECSERMPPQRYCEAGQRCVGDFAGENLKLKA